MRVLFAACKRNEDVRVLLRSTLVGGSTLTAAPVSTRNLVPVTVSVILNKRPELIVLPTGWAAETRWPTSFPSSAQMSKGAYTYEHYYQTSNGTSTNPMRTGFPLHWGRYC